MGLLVKYQNGNATVELNDDGTRVITSPDSSFNFEYPLNIDIRVSTRCAFGRHPESGKSVCGFCHESATTDGVECDYNELKHTLDELPAGIEIAIGCNNLTYGLVGFLGWCKDQGFICNVTINQGHLNRDYKILKPLINDNIIKGLGVSYRRELKWDVRDSILEYPNTVFHVIAGIDDFQDVQYLKARGVKKILVLGEKDFGFNKGEVDLDSVCHQQWKWWLPKLFNDFDVVSFDNLALEQLKVRRFLTDEQWEEFNQGEYSFYINAVEKYLAPSSRSNDITTWTNISLREYFNHIKQLKNGM